MTLKTTKKYTGRGIPRKVPKGWFLCHNHVQPVHPPGTNGFRVFLAHESDRDHFEECHCGWLDENRPGMTHYRGRKTR